MWQKHFDAAERQRLAGKLGKAVDNAVKALETAKQTGNQIQQYETLLLLLTIYTQTQNPALESVLHQFVETGEKAYGAKSFELADALGRRATWCLSRGMNQEAVKCLARTVGILESFDETAMEEHQDSLAETYQELARAQTAAGDFAQAEVTILKVIAHARKTDGPTCVDMYLVVPLYDEILRGLGRVDEANDLNIIAGPTCQLCRNAKSPSEQEHSHLPPELVGRYKTLNEGGDSSDPAAMVSNLQEAIVEFDAWASSANQKLREDDPFRELKERNHLMQSIVLKSTLADLLRVLGRSSEALVLIREVHTASKSPETLQNLMYGLMDEYIKEVDVSEELQELLAEQLQTTAGVYSMALFLYKKEGAESDNAKKALKAAMEHNPHVLDHFGDGIDYTKEPSSFRSEKHREAYQYATEGLNQWASTEGAFEFLSEGLVALLSKGKELAKPSKPR